MARRSNRTVGALQGGAIAALVAAGALAGARSAQPLKSANRADLSFPPDGDALVSARLALDKTALAPGGRADLAIIFTIEPGWHMYWMNPGDTGMGPEIALDLPEGVAQAGDIIWPTPTRRPHDGFMVDNVYENELTLVAPLRVSSDVAPGSTLTIKAALDWLVCADVCLPGSANVSVAARVADRSGDVEASSDAPRIAKARRSAPLPAGRVADLGVQAQWEGATLVIRAPGADRLTYFHFEPRDVPPRDVYEDGRSEGAGLRLPFPDRIAQQTLVRGVVEVERGGRTRAVWISAPINPRAAGGP